MAEILCKRCVLDSGIPDISFDENGICNYCHQFDSLCQDSPIGEAGQRKLAEINAEIKRKGKGRKYDVLIGISGGTDSCFLLHAAIEAGLRPLCVHLDNGWDSDISNSNIGKMLNALGAEMITLKSDLTVLHDLFLSFMKAGLPWIDGPTDIAMVSTLYRTAVKYGIKYIWVGNNFRTEGKQPDCWTHLDSRLIWHIHKRFGKSKLKNFANITPLDLLSWGIVHKIKMVRPLNYIDYNKTEVKKFLAEKYGWEDYGGHHYENDFTKFALINWLYPKFGIDKRKITLSACVRSGEIKREDALEALASPPASLEECLENRRNVEARLNLSTEEMDSLLAGENHTFLDYPSYWHFYKRFGKVINFIFAKVFCFRPMMSYELKKRKGE